MCTFVVVFVSLIGYQKVITHYSAAVTTERAAYIWDNSFRDLETGSFDVSNNDGLYWRTFHDQAYDLFHLFTGSQKSSISLPAAVTNGSGQLANEKLSEAAARLSPAVQGKLVYTNYWIIRKVEASLSKPVDVPPFLRSISRMKMASSAAFSYVVEPAEFVRTVDLARSFIREIQGRIKPSEVAGWLTEPSSLPDEPNVISSEKQAAAYLRRIVNGTAATIPIDLNTNRVVDALDSSRVAHQAIYTFSESQLRTEQLPKDVALLRSGAVVKGVVWHFFKQTKKDKVELSRSLREELSRNGIIVVIHD
jgi:hypothetical protein